MSHAPSPIALYRQPITAGIAVSSITVTLMWWNGTDISPLVTSAATWPEKPWCAVTGALPHFNLMHLAFNIYWLWVFGAVIEPAYGSARMLAMTLLLAVLSDSADYAFARGGVGLSGVGYGLFGFLWVAGPRDERLKYRLGASTIYLFVFWFFLCIYLTHAKIIPVANVAHGAGFACGALLGLCVGVEPARIRRLLAMAALAIMTVFCVIASTVLRPWVNLAGDGGAKWAHQGYQALQEERDADAKWFLVRAVKFSPADARAWFNLGIAEWRLNELDPAVRAIREAADLDPNEPDYRDALSDVLAEQRIAG